MKNRKRQFKIKFSNRQSMAFFVFCAVLYKFLLGYVYAFIIHPVFQYGGFVNNGTGVDKLVSWFIFLCSLILWLKVFKNDNWMSHEIFFLLFLIVFTPFTVMTGYGVFSNQYIVCNTIYWFVLLVLMQLPVKVMAGKELFLKFPGQFDSGKSFLKAVFLATACIIIFVAGRYGGFRVSLNLLDVYGRREMASEADIPTIFRYLMGWAQMLLPICIGFFIKTKQWLWTVLGIIVGILSFGFDGSKTAFALVLLAFVLNFLPNTGLRRLNSWIFLAANFGMILSVLEFRIRHTYFLASYAVRRVMFVPELLRSNYFDFFTHHTPDYFKSSFLRHFGIKTEYEDMPRMISALYYPDRPVFNANNGLISDAVTNLGLAGIFLMPVLIVIIMKVLDRWTDRMYFTVYLSFGVGVAFYFSNSFLLTILMSHGMLIAMLVMRRLNKYKWKKYETGNR